MLGPAKLLEVWESAQDLVPSDRALKFLDLASPLSEAEALHDLTIGERDQRLMQLRKSLFGSSLEIQVPCDACRETMEATLDLDQVAAPGGAGDSHYHAVEIKGRSFRVRAPTVKDVAELRGIRDRNAIVMALLASCVQESNGTTLDPAHISSDDVAEIAQYMAQIDSAADIVVALACPHCGASSQKCLDITHILFREIGDYARQMLHDIHVIASAYGWTESDILSISATRRRAYLDMITL
jgi:hypothetical protein